MHLFENARNNSKSNRYCQLLAALGLLLAALGVLLGRSWGALGRSWAALGPLLERHAKFIQKSMPKMADVDTQEGAKMTPKSNPKVIKHRCKKRTEKRTNITRNQEPPNHKKCWKALRKIKTQQKHISMHFYPILAPQMIQSGTQKRSKHEQNNNTKNERIFSTGELIQLGIGFGTFIIFLTTVLINANA